LLDTRPLSESPTQGVFRKYDVRLIDHLNHDLAWASARSERKAIRLQYFRAAVETMISRSLTSLPKPRAQRINRKPNDPVVIVGYVNFWNRRTDNELAELFEHLAPYFTHHTNRGTRF